MPRPLARQLIGAILVVALAGAAGFLLQRRVASPPALTPVAANSAPDVPAEARPETPPVASSTPSAPPRARPIPDRVPAITLAGLDGKPRALADFHDPVLIINFWATWCVPCRREIPLLQQLRREQHPNGVEVVGIAVDFADAVRSFVRQIGLNYPVLIGEEDGLAAADAFGIDMVLPFTVFADAQRRIVAVKVGELHADEARLIVGTVRRVNAGKLDLALARTEIAGTMRDLAAERARRTEAAPQS